MAKRIVKKILVCRTDRIGDLVLSSAVAECIKKHFPGCTVSFLVRKGQEDIVRENPFVDEILSFNASNIAAKLALIVRLRLRHFDAALILHSTRSVNTIVFLAGVPVRIGYRRKGNLFLTKSFPYLKKEGTMHECEYSMKLLEFLGIHDTECLPKLWPSPESRETVRALFRRHGIECEHKVIVIHPGASCPSRRWPTARFAELARRLLHIPGIKILITSSPDERFITEDFLTKLGADARHVIDLSGALSLGELIGLLSRVTLLISNDSGPVHVAAAVGTPSISLFSRKNPGLSPTRWRSLEPRSIYIHKDAGCVECLAHNCKKGFLCLQAITPEEVFRAAEKFLR